MDREEIIQNIVTCIEFEGDGGCSSFTSEQKEAMKRFMDSVRGPVRLDNKTIVEEVRKLGRYPNEFDVARRFYTLGRQSIEQPVEIEKNVRISPGMVSNFGASSFVLDVELTEEERGKLNIVPGFGGGIVKIKILCE